MAIGDTTNPNLFGTQNNKKEKESNAELAAQNAMMGAGGMPASAFGQAPAVAPFSMEAAGQVNPMMQPQSLEVTPQAPNPTTFLPYADDVATPPASALSVFTPGGDLKPNVDVNAITPSPDVNAEANPQPPLNNALLEMLQRGDERQSMGLPRQVAPGIIDAPSSVVDPFTGKTIEKPTAFAADNSLPAGMTMNQAAIMNALPDQNQGMDVNQQAIANAQSQGVAQDQNETPAALGGMTLNEYLNAPAGTPGVSGLRTDPQGRMIPAGFETRAEAFSDFERESAAREARLGARPDFGEAVSDRDRRAARGDDISMADQTAMAKANARGATPSEVARGNQVANALGVDLKTGQSLQAAGGLTFEQQLSLRKQNFAEGKFDYELAKDAKTAYSEGIEASRKATTEEAQADTAGRTMVSAISNMNDAMTRMGGRSGEFFGGGFFGKMASYLPGTSAYDQVADVEFLQSNVALNAMSELKELSPTGSTGFGALSEKELRVLTDKYANLNPFVSADLFQGNLKQLQGEFNNMLNNAWDKHSKEYSPEAANAVYGNRGGSASGATGTPGQAIPNDRNITSAADTLLSDPKYN